MSRNQDLEVIRDIDKSRQKLLELSSHRGSIYKDHIKNLENEKKEKKTDSPKSESSDDIVVEISSKTLKTLVSAHVTPNTLHASPAMLMRRTDSMDDLIMAPTTDDDQIYNLNALLLAQRNSVRFDTKCFELMYDRSVKLNKWISRLIHFIGFITLMLSLAGVAKLSDMQPYILGTITLLFGMNGYKDHEHLESGVEALDQCVNFTNEIYTDVNYFLYRSNHTIEALNVFVSAIDDKLKIFDRTTRLPIPLKIKNKVLDIVRAEKEEWAKKQKENVHLSIDASIHNNPGSIYQNIKRKRKSPRNSHY